MFESKYSKLLTVLLAIVIIAILGLLGFLGYNYYDTCKIHGKALNEFDELHKKSQDIPKII